MPGRILARTAKVGMVGSRSPSRSLFAAYTKAGFDVTKIRATDFDSVNWLDFDILVLFPPPASADDYSEKLYLFLSTAGESIAEVGRGLGAYSRPEILVILGSESDAHSIEQWFIPEFSEHGWKIGREVFVCFSPRLPSQNDRPRIIGGATPFCAEIGTLFYRQIFKDVVNVVSISHAEWLAKAESTSPFIPPNITLPNAETQGPMMQRETTVTVEGDRYKATTTVEADRYISGSIAYVPFAVAAAAAQTTEKSLRDWIKKKIKFDGRPILTHRLRSTGKLYVSEESIARVANRFIKWPSREPAGAVTIGEAENQSGFLPISEAAGILGISGRTMWLWTTQGKAPTDKPLDVIKCTTSEYFYVREKDVNALKALIPRSGLQRGRRPHATLGIF